MIESRSQRDVDALMQHVRANVLLRRQLMQWARGDVLEAADELLDTTSIDALVAAIARRCDPRQELPPRMRFFPFTMSFVQNFVLKVYNNVFREQRLMHSTAVAALRELTAVNRDLYRRVALLEARLQREQQPSE